jgi:hypothetical protein
LAHWCLIHFELFLNSTAITFFHILCNRLFHSWPIETLL